MKSIALFFSGGKDSTLALHRLKGTYDVRYLISTITADFDRVSIHGVRRTLLEKQSESLGIPLRLGLIPANATNEIYEEAMSEVLIKLKEEGIDTIAFGDIFLEDIRQYRENMLSRLGMKAIFPLWMEDTRALAEEFIDLGFRAVITSSFYPQLLGMEFNRAFLERLREMGDGIDPCGEKGEFHTFVYDGPLFSHPIRFMRGEKLIRQEGYSYIDLVPDSDKGEHSL